MDTYARTVEQGVRSAPHALPALALAGCATAAAWVDRGSILGSAWLHYGVIAGLALAVVLAVGQASSLGRARAAGASALLGLGSLGIASLDWAPERSLARNEGLLALLYAAVLLVGWVTLSRDEDRLWASGFVAAGCAGVAIATAAKLTSANPLDVYYDGRLDFPIGYPNAQAAFFAVGIWPAIALASRRTLHPAARGAACSAATVLLCGWIATQSKGAGIGLAASAVALFAASHTRLRLLVPTVLAAGCAGAFWSPLVAPYRNESPAVLHRAGWTILLAAAVALAAGCVYAAVDRRVEPGPRLLRFAGAAALAALVAALAVTASSFFVLVNHPGRFAQHRWESFKHFPAQDTTSTHFLTLGSNRYDFWRVALKEFRSHPVAGIGAEGFRVAYLREGRSGETPRRAHSLALDVLAEEGVVGLALLVAGLGIAIRLCARQAAARPVSAAALAAAVGWLVHASVDWTWSFPAIGIPLFLLLAAGSAPTGSARLSRRVALPAATAALVVAVAGFLPAWLAARLSDHGSGLALARALDPLSPDPWLARYEATGSTTALARAVDRAPRSADLRFALGLAYLRLGRDAEARAQLEAARRLYPRSPAIAAALKRARPPASRS
ncbi:MAG TPA: O-antigen ligase family protein [Gaiellaceae bacterium]|jgi:O-antigen ligase